MMTDRRIQILPSLLSNQIAAGEVVERPASIVKELVENSIDAGAHNIEIRIEEGGMLAITVIDDGTGIFKEDLALAVHPHATSKIYSLDELENLQSLGFRGEALASIASVSRFLLKSRHKESGEAWQIELEGKGTLPEIKPDSLPRGTRIEIRDLFFNTPARRKFLKSQMTEFSHIEEVVRKLALSHMEIGFSLQHNHKLIFRLEANQPQKRIEILCGKDFAEHSLFIQVQKTGFALEGWLVQPAFLKRSAEFQYFYVNGRPIRDKLILHAMKEAYRDVLYSDYQPQYILFLEIDPRAVDFNVHPAKLEVRFRESRLVHDFVYSEVKKALAGQNQNQPFCHDKKTETVSQKQDQYSFSSSKPFTKTDLTAAVKAPHLQSFVDKPQISAKALDLFFEPSAEQVTQMPQNKRFGRALCQVKGLFILAENNDGLVIIDMHAAHERVLYERLKQNWHKAHWERQLLLLPQTVELTRHEEAVYKEHQTEIAEMGFVIDEWMDQKIMFREVPITLAKANLAEFMRTLLKDLALLGHSQQIGRAHV